MILRRFQRRKVDLTVPDAVPDSALRRLLRAMPPPPVSPELALRITREVPTLPQSSQPAPPYEPRARPQAANVVLSGPALWQRRADAGAIAAPGARRAASWNMTRLGHFAGLAAAVAVVVLIMPEAQHPLPESQPSSLALSSTPALSPTASHASVAAQVQTVPTRPAPMRIAMRDRARPSSTAPLVRAPAEPAVDAQTRDSPVAAAAQPLTPDLPPASAIAVAGPVAGPVDLPAGVSPHLGSHGVMGPVLPQALGMTGSGTSGGDFGMAPGGPPARGGRPH